MDKYTLLAIYIAGSMIIIGYQLNTVEENQERIINLLTSKDK